MKQFFHTKTAKMIAASNVALAIAIVLWMSACFMKRTDAVERKPRAIASMTIEPTWKLDQHTVRAHWYAGSGNWDREWIPAGAVRLQVYPAFAGPFKADADAIEIVADYAGATLGAKIDAAGLNDEYVARVRRAGWAEIPVVGCDRVSFRTAPGLSWQIRFIR